MNYKVIVTLQRNPYVASIVCKDIHLTEDKIVIKGTDPEHVPDKLHEHVTFVSSELQTIIEHDSEIMFVDVRPTHEEVPQAEPSF